MPKCVECTKTFPKRIEIDGVQRNLQRRKRCFDCSPFGARKTSPLNRLTDRRCGRALNADGKKECKWCGREFDTQGSACATCQVNQRRFARKRQAVEYKGGSCILCGYNRCVIALTFHHRNPSEKLFDIAGNHCRRWEVYKAELDKCDLVCRNCHAEIEYDLGTSVNG